MYSYVINIADSESNLSMHSTALVLKNTLIKLSKTLKPSQKTQNPQNRSQTLTNPQNHKNPSNHQKNFESYQGVHDQDVLIDQVHFPEGGKIQIFPKLEQYCANQY